MDLFQKKANLHVSVFLDIKKICTGTSSWDPKADLVLFLGGTENIVWEVCVCHKQGTFKHSWGFCLSQHLRNSSLSDNPGNAFAVSGRCPRNSSGSLGRSHPEFHFAWQTQYDTEHISICSNLAIPNNRSFRTISTVLEKVRDGSNFIPRSIRLLE